MITKDDLMQCVVICEGQEGMGEVDEDATMDKVLALLNGAKSYREQWEEEYQEISGRYDAILRGFLPLDDKQKQFWIGQGKDLTETEKSKMKQYSDALNLLKYRMEILKLKMKADTMERNGIYGL